MFSKQRVLEIVQRRPFISFYNLVKAINLHPRENRVFSQFLGRLRQSGALAFSKKHNGYYIPALVGRFESLLKMRTDYGFVSFVHSPEEAPRRAIVFSENFNHAINDDRVLIDVYAEADRDDQYFAIVVQVLERKYKVLYGQIDATKRFIPLDFPGQKYQFKFDPATVQPQTFVKFALKAVVKTDLYLELVCTLSGIDAPYGDLDLLVASMNLDHVFNDQVLAEAALIPDSVTEPIDPRRTDCRAELVVTIDGAKTKDFDDAISVTKAPNQNYILTVHIADVAHYVREGSAIDQQAESRATSIYLLDRVIPMLPEKLSNGICSLNPNADRYTLSLEAEIDPAGLVVKSRIYPAIIRSKYRLTYDQVATYTTDPVIRADSKLVQMLAWAYELSAILSEVKTHQGYIDFEIEEPVIELDAQGQPVAIAVKPRLRSEVLIENFMVLANEQVSQIVTRAQLPCIYRVHEPPGSDKLSALEAVLKVVDLASIKVHHSDDPRVFAQTVAQLKSHRFDNFMKINLLRTMQKAKYARINIGHFGLASRHYSHFTSPIRRYPDLALHRLIWELLINNNTAYLANLPAKLDHIASLASQKEEAALTAERRVNDVKKAEFYGTRIGQILPATIVSVQKFGLFIEFADKVDALVHVSVLSDQECTTDALATQMVCGDHRYQLGQAVMAQIISISKLEGKVDAKLVNS